jgi:GNAT superfamily N-acetyltransferase
LNLRPAPLALRRSPEDSARFGLEIWRADIARLDAPSLIDALRRERVDVAIIRLPAQALPSIHSLADVGLTPLVADTRVTYDIALTDAESDEDNVELVAAMPEDAPRLEARVREIFARYPTHYHVNPLLAADDILDGYAEWAASFVRSSSPECIAWHVALHDEIVGFSCCTFDAASGEAVGVLNGIAPTARGRGIYRAMFRRMLSTLAKRGARRFSIATQAHNIAVQRVWTSEGLGLRSAANTIHINSLFNRESRSA